MVEIADIRDKYSLEAWLEDQPHEVAVWIASRAAARVMPVWWAAVLTEEWARERNLTALPVLRSLLISSVAAVGPTEDIRAATAATADAATADAATTTADASYASYADAATAAIAASYAAYATAATADAATAASYAAYVADAADAVWAAIRTDAEQAAGGGLPDAFALWPEDRGPLAEQWREIVWQVTNSEGAEDWQFWVAWYDSLLDGRPMLGDAARTRKMLEDIALIDPETWDAGPEAVNPAIREIWEGYRDGASGTGPAVDPEPVSADAKAAMKQRVAVNRDALAVSAAGLLDQLGTFKDHVRGMNHLEPKLRDEVLAFIDEFTGKITALLERLPRPGESVDDDQAGRLVQWLRDYRGLLRHKLAYYGSAENMVEATVPTGIILGATGIGAMLGMPVAGSIAGGLIANQMKPGQAARALVNPSAKDGEAP